uniref:Uncharacterized protein n=1 Tax=Anguilla anguilla TaxID=7936 RepID=A0A0E9PBE9_ANGAN
MSTTILLVSVINFCLYLCITFNHVYILSVVHGWASKIHFS